MKKLLFYVLIATMFASCASPQGMSSYQAKNISKFLKKKRYRTMAGPRYIRAKKRGSVMHPAVSKETRKEQIRRIRAQRYTVSN